MMAVSSLKETDYSCWTASGLRIDIHHQETEVKIGQYNFKMHFFLDYASPDDILKEINEYRKYGSKC